MTRVSPTRQLCACMLLFMGLVPLSPALELSSLSNADASAGLKKALDQGINEAVDKLGVAGGFLNDPRVKIPLPPKLEKAEGALRLMGLGGQAD